MPYITITQLREKLRPLEGARFLRNALGERPYVDLQAAWLEDSDDARKGYPDCDIRGLTGKGVVRHWDGGEDCIEWGLIRSATFGDYRRGDDGFLHYYPRVTYHIITFGEREGRAAGSYVPQVAV